MMQRNEIDWGHEFHRNLATIERVIATTSRKNRLDTGDAEEFRSYTMLKLIEQDYARLRKFGGRSSLATYLNVVVGRLLLDFRVSHWGKWRPSAQAKSLGPIGVHLERLVHRDGFTYAEACEILFQKAELRASRDWYWKAFRSLPSRRRRQWLDVTRLADSLCAPEMSDPLEEEARRDLALATREVIGAVLAGASPLARKALFLRYRGGATVSRIADEHGMKPRDMSRLIAKTLDEAREALVTAGISWENVSDALSARNGERIFDELFDSEEWNVAPEGDVAA